MRRSIITFWNVVPPLIRAAAGASLLLSFLALVLKLLGASWQNVAFAVIPLAGALIFMAIEPRLQGLTRAKPKLTLAIGGAEDGRLLAVGLAPWPLDVERIVENEAAEALSTVRDGGLPIPALAIGLFSRPTPEDHQQAKEQFSSEVATYKEELREWLGKYSQAALAHWGTFEVALMLTNAPRASYAEDVEVVLELPDSVTSEAPCSAVGAPPERPTYVPPQPQRLDPFGRMRETGFAALPPVLWRRNLEDLISTVAHSSRAWDVSTNGCRLVAPKAHVQPGRTIEIGEPLSLRAHGPGEHEIHWTLYSRSLDEPVSGSIVLVVPEGDPQRPPFGRMAGILRYPDAPIIIDDDDAQGRGANGEPLPVRQIRASDPPLHPPSATSGEEDGVLATLQAAAQCWEWEALGLDPALDGPSSDRVSVEPARRVRP
jgi:hypothetical protein